jgi:putative two-component system response regulator
VSRILVIDDEDVIRRLMIEILENAGHTVGGAETAERALTLLDAGEFDLVVSDIVMPGLSGLELIEAARSRRASLPVVLVTGASTYDTLSQALTYGAAGLVTKPFAHADLQDAVDHALERASRSRDELRERLLAPTLASALANAIEARDSYLHGHCERLAALTVRIGEVLGLGPDEIEILRLGAILHDIGKIGIPDRVLLKPGPLDDEEWLIAKQHPLIGDKLLEPLDLLSTARPIVRHHHERWDGQGYPDALAGSDIPLGARIVAVADSVEVMSSRQLYRRPRTISEIVAELHRQRGAQWDVVVVDIVLDLIDSGELLLEEGGLRVLEPALGPQPGPAHPPRQPERSSRPPTEVSR